MEKQEVVVVAVPFPGQSHLNQLLHFSLILSARGLAVHFAAPAASIRQAQLRLQGWPLSSLNNIYFHSLPLPPSPPPSPHHLSHALRLFETPLLLRQPLATLLRSLSPASRRLIVLHDPFMSVAGLEAASLPNAESYTFQCVSAFQALFEVGPDRLHIMTRPGPDDILKSIITAHFEDWVPEPILDCVQRLQHDTPVEAGIIANSCRPIDGDFVDLLAEEHPSKKIFAVSPLHLLGSSVDESSQEKWHYCLKFLDKQPPESVVYVSFGSVVTITGEQVEKLATGLRRSGQRFIWVLREEDKGAIRSGNVVKNWDGGLPEGFEEEMEGVGVVVREWAPQLEILAHPSTGAFVTHCGWNSTMESLSSGVPIIAWPMQLDQPRNAMLVTEHLKVGVKMREWDCRKEVVLAERVEEVVRMVMEGEEGKEMRVRVKKLGEAVQGAVAEGGSSKADLNSFVSHITRL